MANKQHLTFSLAVLLGTAMSLLGGDPADGITQTGRKVGKEINEVSDGVFRFNIRTKTLGGKQFWTDYLVQHQWRIQRNEVTNHYRLLNDDNYRHAWGTFQQCKKSLLEIDTKKNLPEVKGKVVLLLHGLGRSRGSMEELHKHLDQRAGLTAISLSYASTRASIEQHAQALSSVIKNIPQASEIHFVGHSMGNLVIRYYLSAEDNPDPRIRRIVMLAPPNQGSALATLFKDNHLFQIFWGTSGEQIAVNWDELAKKLATPECEFGIIAGGTIKSLFSNPFIKGEDDLVLRVEETRLEGARDFAIVPSYHGRIMNHAQTKEYTSRFLEKGHFISELRRTPITPAEAEQP
ncbi:MAG: alpha/beta fold hydrolase [Planctomycetota bacterium]|nr:alpha/beta fold hydrolase [Planctomycetota bacterium]